MTRRDALRNIGNGFGMLGLSHILAPQSPAAPHFAPKAKHIIYLFLNGGPSQVDTFDPKPLLTKYDGKGVPAEFAKDEKFKKELSNARLLGSPFAFRKYGRSGLEVSDLFPHVGKMIDEVSQVQVDLVAG